MEQIVPQIIGGITLNVNVTIKNICDKDYIWNPAKCSCKNGKYLASIMDDSAMTCDEIIDADAEAKSNKNTKSNDEETKTIPTNFNEENITGKMQVLYFTCIFINYHRIIGSFWCLVLSDKISSKTKTFIIL